MSKDGFKTKIFFSFLNVFHIEFSIGANMWLVSASAHVLIDLITDLSTKGCFFHVCKTELKRCCGVFVHQF